MTTLTETDFPPDLPSEEPTGEEKIVPLSTLTSTPEERNPTERKELITIVMESTVMTVKPESPSNTNTAKTVDKWDQSP